MDDFDKKIKEIKIYRSPEEYIKNICKHVIYERIYNDAMRNHFIKISFNNKPLFLYLEWNGDFIYHISLKTYIENKYKIKKSFSIFRKILPEMFSQFNIKSISYSTMLFDFYQKY